MLDFINMMTSVVKMLGSKQKITIPQTPALPSARKTLPTCLKPPHLGTKDDEKRRLPITTVHHFSPSLNTGTALTNNHASVIHVSVVEPFRFRSAKGLSL